MEQSKTFILPQCSPLKAAQAMPSLGSAQFLIATHRTPTPTRSASAVDMSKNSSASQNSRKESDQDNKLSPHSCNYCSVCFQANDGYPQPRTRLKFPATIRQSRRAARDGCPIFRGLCKLLDERSTWLVVRTHFFNKCACCVTLAERMKQVFDIFSNRPFRLVLESVPLENMYGTTLQSYAYLDVGGHVRGRALNAYTYSGDPAASMLPAIELQTNGPSTIDSLKKWLSTCSCVPSTASARHERPFTPTRLIDLGAPVKNREITIRKPSPSSAHAYLCLSYCWGGAQPLHCTNERLDASGGWTFSLDELPATFNDAIEITRSLGYRHLWIDSLCIVQDDEQDMDREINAMSQIYESAALTICASTAKSCFDGFLQERPDYAEWQIPLKFSNGQQGLVRLDGYNWFEPPKEEPLGTRAWAFQERLLSPRILEFGWRTTRWSCNCSSSYAGNQNLVLHDAQSGASTKELPYNQFLYVNPQGDRHFSRSKEDLYKSWAFVVERYSSLKLTLPDDRLAAVGGIAQELQSTTGVRYLAGLWDYERLPSLLQWQVTSCPATLLPRPKTHRASSWSWVSIDDAVMMHHSEETVNGFSVLARDVGEGFGKTARGWIQLEGPLKHGIEWSRAEKLRIGTPEAGTETEQDLIIWPDCSDGPVPVDENKITKSDLDELSFAAVGRVSWDRELVRGLILKSEECCQTYTRCGLFQFRDLAQTGKRIVELWDVERYKIV